MCKTKLIEMFCEQFDHDKSEFEPTQTTDKERIEELEACILELAGIIGGEEE